MRSYFWVGLGGGLGALLRYGVSIWVASPVFPWNFLIINLTGSLVIGMIMALAIDFSLLSQDVRLFSAVGIMGGYTTFSTFTYGVYRLYLLHQIGYAILYSSISLVGGLLSCGIGIIIAKVIVGKWRQLSG